MNNKEVTCAVGKRQMTHILFQIFILYPQPMKFSKEHIESYFPLKLTRAVDKIFTENKVPLIYDFYSCLQDCKKGNTNSLRSTLEQNYDKMLYCSDIMEKVRAYAGEVKKVAAHISEELDPEQGKKDAGEEAGSELMKVELKIKKCCFAQAANEIQGLCANASLAGGNRYYVKYLNIELLTKMQGHMGMHRLTKTHLNQYLESLKILVFVQSSDGFKVREGVQKMCTGYQMPSIFTIISKKAKAEQGTSIEQKKCLKICHEVIFQYKLYLLASQCKGSTNSEPFEAYFSDLTTLLGCPVQQAAFPSIFLEALPNIKKQLAMVFISRSASGEIIFNYNLYDSVIRSESFAAVLKAFYEKMVSLGASIDNPIVFIQQLWQDYFINLVDYSLDHLLPIAASQQLQMYSMATDTLPPELRAYQFDRSIEGSQASLNSYLKKLDLFGQNMAPTIQRCTNDEREMMISKLSDKMSEVLAKIHDEIEKLLQDASSLKFRQLILLALLTQSLLQRLATLSAKFSIWKDSQTLDQIIAKHQLHPLFYIFSTESPKSFQQTFNAFDGFFVGYTETFSSENKHIVGEKIRSVSLRILSEVQANYRDRERDLVQHTLESLKQGKEKVTVMQYMLTPYLAHRIFKCKINEKKMDQKLYAKYFQGENKNAYPTMNQPAEEQEDDFEIGDKEDNDEVVKLGKSLMAIGNNFISGFMPKRRQ